MSPMADEMSPTRLPGTAAAIPATSARSAASYIATSSSWGVPTKQVIAESATQPSTSAAKSRLTLSPALSRKSYGSPGRTAALTEGYRTLQKGIAPNDG